MPWSHLCWSCLHWPQRTPVLGSEGPGHLVQSHVLSCGFQSPAPCWAGTSLPATAGWQARGPSPLSACPFGPLVSFLQKDSEWTIPGFREALTALKRELEVSCLEAPVLSQMLASSSHGETTHRDGRVTVGPGRSRDIPPPGQGAWLPRTSDPRTAPGSGSLLQGAVLAPPRPSSSPAPTYTLSPRSRLSRAASSGVGRNSHAFLTPNVSDWGIPGAPETPGGAAGLRRCGRVWVLSGAIGRDAQVINL